LGVVALGFAVLVVVVVVVVVVLGLVTRPLVTLLAVLLVLVRGLDVFAFVVELRFVEGVIAASIAETTRGLELPVFLC
jgi:hypothetical protein